MAILQALPADSLQVGNGTALSTDLDVGLNGVKDRKCYRGVWIFNNSTTNNLLIDYRSAGPKASLSFRLPPEEDCFIPLQDPNLLLVRGQAVNVAYSWYAM